MAKFTKYDQEMLEIFSDPAKWAEHHLGEKPRTYQEEILRHPHHRKVLRCGRRIGKCIQKDQRVMNPQTGEYKTVEELYTSQQQTPLFTLNERYHLEESSSFFIEDNGEKDVFEVETKYGATVTLTGNHPVLTLDGWVEVDALKIGDRIATPRTLASFGKKSLSVEELTYEAMLLSNAIIREDKLVFKAKTKTQATTIRNTLNTYNMDYKEKEEIKWTHFILQDSLSETKKEEIKSRKINDVIYQLDRENLSYFLKVLFELGGTTKNTAKPEICYVSKERSLLKNIKHLLLRFGVISNIHFKGDVYILIIQKLDALISFEKEIVPERQDMLDVINRAHRQDFQEQTIPSEVWKYIEEERIQKGMMKKEVIGGNKDERFKMHLAPTISKVRRYAENLRSEFLYDLSHSDLIWEAVVDIRYKGKEQTYDVFVPETHNLVVEDILVHNTWTMTAHMLWVAFTCNGGTELQKGATCLVATPYDTQAREIFDQLNNFINNSQVLMDSVHAIRRSPYEIVFKNKSRIKLYTAGSRSGSEGGNLRGQKAS